MNAMVFYGKGDMRLERAARPQVKPDELLVQVKACGVCGTDLHIYSGMPGSASVVPPLILGHEFAGVVAEIGSGVQGFRLGDRVAVDPNDMCGSCDFCRNGQAHFCRNATAYGVTKNGGFAEYTAVRAKQAYKIPAGVSFVQGALAETVSCCLHGIELAQVQPGSVVLVLGAGPIGLLMVQLARLNGAAAVVVSEPVAASREKALALGADIAIDPLAMDIGEECRRRGIGNISVVIECSGTPQAVVQGLQNAGKGATVMLFGLTSPDCEVPLRPFEVFQKELKITSSFINPYTFGRAVALLEGGRIDIDAVVGCTLPLASLLPVFEKGAHLGNGKVVAVMEDSCRPINI